MKQIREISRLCSIFDNMLTYRSAFLLGFYGFLCISNVAPPFQKSFSVDKHLLRQDVMFHPPGLILNLNGPERVHTIKLPHVQDPVMYPTQSIPALFKAIPLPPTAPLFMLEDGVLLTQTLLRKHLVTILRPMDLPLMGFGYIFIQAFGSNSEY